MKPHWKLALAVLVIVLLGTLGYNAFSVKDTVPVVIQCQPPTDIKVTSSLKASADLSLTEAIGSIDTHIGSDLEANFASADPNSWLSVIKTYQWETCQFINASRCGEQSEEACRAAKQKMRDDAFAKILAIYSKQQERLGAEREKQRQARIDACSAAKVVEHEAPKSMNITGGARAPGPGFGGARQTDTRDLCHTVGDSQRILSASTTQTGCIGNRCSVTAPVFSDNHRKVCVQVTAWSDSGAFTGGGSAEYRLGVVFKDVVTPADIAQYRAACAADSS